MMPYIGVSTCFVDEKQRKTELWPVTIFFLKTVKSWIDYRARPRIGLSANIDAPCDMFKIKIKEPPMRSLNITKTVTIPF